MKKIILLFIFFSYFIISLNTIRDDFEIKDEVPNQNSRHQQEELSTFELEEMERMKKMQFPDQQNIHSTQGNPYGQQYGQGHPGQGQQQDLKSDGKIRFFGYSFDLSIPYEIEKLLEITSFILFGLYILNFIIGRYQLISRLERWNNQTKEVISNEYAHIGFHSVNSTEFPFVKISNSEYLYYASGRVNVNYMSIYFRFSRLYNLIYRFTDSSDYSIVKFTIRTNFSIPFVACISRKSYFTNQIKAKNRPDYQFDIKVNDINFFTESYKNAIEDKELSVKAEDLESYNSIFYSDSSFKKSFLKIQPQLMYLSISDKSSIDSNDSVIICALKYSSNQEESIFQVGFIHDLMNRLLSVRIKAGKEGIKKRDEFDNKLRIEKERVEEYNRQRPDNASCKKSNVSNKINMKSMKGKNDDKGKSINKLIPPTLSGLKKN